MHTFASCWPRTGCGDERISKVLRSSMLCTTRIRLEAAAKQFYFGVVTLGGVFACTP